MSEWISVKDQLPADGLPVFASENVNDPSAMWIFERHDEGEYWYWSRIDIFITSGGSDSI